MLSSCTDNYTAEILTADSGAESQVAAPSGRTRSYDEALKIARRSIGIVDGPEVTRAGKARTIRDGRCVTRQSTRNDGIEQTDTLVYVFNFDDNAGFSIIAANRCVSPVLVVTEQGNYEYGQPTGIEGFDNYMDSMTAELYSIIDAPMIPAIKFEYSETEILREDKVEPLCTTKWDQDGVFGAYCSNGVAGCTTIAMAQIMAYWEYPDSITTTYTDKNKNVSITPNYDGIVPDIDNPNAQHIGETFYIHWNEIKNHKTGCSSASCEQNHWEISALIKQIGELNSSVYFTYPTDASKNYTSVYSHNSFPTPFSRTGYNKESLLLHIFDWDYVRSELNNLRPLIIDASSGRGGHTWVLDGYIDKEEKTTYYEFDHYEFVGKLVIPHYNITSVVESQQQLVHFNWGWGGECDGYFTATNSFSTAEGVEYDSIKTITHDLNFLQQNVTLQGGIYPKTE